MQIKRERVASKRGVPEGEEAARRLQALDDA
jgi:hypothetical protein